MGGQGPAVKAHPPSHQLRQGQPSHLQQQREGLCWAAGRQLVLHCNSQTLLLLIIDPSQAWKLVAVLAAEMSHLALSVARHVPLDFIEDVSAAASTALLITQHSAEPAPPCTPLLPA